MSALKTLSNEQVNAALTGPLAAWRLEQNHLCRRYGTDNWRASLMVANTIGHLAEAAWHHPELEVSFGSVAVRLQTHDAGGITDKDVDLARQIELVVSWRPASADTDAPAYVRSAD